MAKKSKMSLFGIIIAAVLLVTFALTVVGLCIDWTATTVEIAGKSSTTTTTFPKWLEAQATAKDNGAEGNKKFETNAAFAIITAILGGLTLISYGAKILTKSKIANLLTLALSALLIVSAVVTISTAYAFTGDMGSASIGDFAKGGTVPAAGAWLVTIFGAVGGVCGLLGALRKN